MDLGYDNTSVAGRYDACSDAELLAEVRAEARGRQASIIREWAAVVSWADRNTVATMEGAATVVEGVIDTGVPIAGDGAPLVSEFNLMELIASLGRSPDGGRIHVGQVIECAWRLPNVYAAVLEGRVEPWRALRIADLTRGLNADAAAFVDRQLFNVGGVTWAQIERLVDEAIRRHDPEAAEQKREAAADRRRFDIGDTDANGLVLVDGLMDAADGFDLNEAITRRAIELGRLGDDSPFDVRRSKAAAELARADLAMDLIPVADEEPQRPSHDDATSPPRRAPGRRVVLNVHLTDTSLVGNNPVARWEEGQCPVSVEQVREWLRVHDTRVTIRPVIDLKDHVPVGSYEIPDRIRARVELRDHQCRFPGCSKKASKCDLDHCRPYAEGGPTCPCQLVALCRRHHRAKTFSLWRYVIVQPGTYLWLSPHGQHVLVDHAGTRCLDPPRRLDPEATAGSDDY